MTRQTVDQTDWVNVVVVGALRHALAALLVIAARWVVETSVTAACRAILTPFTLRVAPTTPVLHL